MNTTRSTESIERPDHRLTRFLFLLAGVWWLATPTLFALAFGFGFSVGESNAQDPALADVFGVGLYAVGLGAPVIGAITAAVGRRPVVAALFAAGGLLLLLAARQIAWFPLG